MQFYFGCRAPEVSFRLWAKIFSHPLICRANKQNKTNTLFSLARRQRRRLKRTRARRFTLFFTNFIPPAKKTPFADLLRAKRKSANQTTAESSMKDAAASKKKYPHGACPRILQLTQTPFEFPTPVCGGKKPNKKTKTIFAPIRIENAASPSNSSSGGGGGDDVHRINVHVGGSAPLRVLLLLVPRRRRLLTRRRS